jgi:hypothetical protein
MFNPISFINSATVTATAVTLGYAPGQQTPPQLLVCSPGAAQTITLPPTSTTVPSVPTTAQSTVGVSGGYRITIFNTTTFSVTCTGAGSDTIVGTASVATVNGKFTLQADPGPSLWYVVS